MNALRRSRHTRARALSPNLLTRIEWIHEILSEVDGTSLRAMTASFRRDPDPEAEVAIWQRIALSFQLYCRRHPGLANHQRRGVLEHLVSISMPHRHVPDDQLMNEVGHAMFGAFADLPDTAGEEIRSLYDAFR